MLSFLLFTCSSVLRRQQCHCFRLLWVSACCMLFYLPLNQNVYQGLLQETKVWFQIQHLCLVTCLFGSRYTRTDFPISALNGRVQWELQASPVDPLPVSRHAYWQSHPVPLQRSPIQLDVKDTNKSWANEERSGKKDAGCLGR